MGDLELAAIEVGYVAIIALLTRGATVVAKRVEAWRTARGLRKIWAAAHDDAPVAATCDYRTNAAAHGGTPEASPSSWLSRRRAERAARYVQKLEDAATMKR